MIDGVKMCINSIAASQKLVNEDEDDFSEDFLGLTSNSLPVVNNNSSDLSILEELKSLRESVSALQ